MTNCSSFVNVKSIYSPLLKKYPAFGFMILSLDFCMALYLAGSLACFCGQSHAIISMN